ncbi:MAG TPA: hypothetical protein VGG45_11415 [Terracidiphilus sp.]|jgi:hypothetical protein
MIPPKLGVHKTGSSSGGTNAFVGGLDGWTVADVTTSFSTAAVTGGSGSLIGGLLGGDGQSSLSDNYWDTTTSGADQGTGEGNESGVTGVTSRQLKSGLPAGFNPLIWAEDKKINNGFPYLIANPPPKK